MLNKPNSLVAWVQIQPRVQILPQVLALLLLKIVVGVLVCFPGNGIDEMSSIVVGIDDGT